MINFIIYFFLALFTSFMLLNVYKKYSENKKSLDKKDYLKILFFSLLTCANNLYMYTSVRVIFSTIILILFFKSIYKDKLGTSIYYTICITISLILSDFLFALVLPLGINNIAELNNNILFKIIFSIVSTLLSCILAGNKFTIYFFKKIKKIVIPTKLFYILGIISILIFNVWMFIIGNSVANKSLNIIIISGDILIIFLIIIIFKEKYETFISKIKEEQLEQNLKLYISINNEYRTLKHNLMNDLLTIKTVVNKRNQTLINDIINKYKSNYNWINDLTNIPDGISGLIFLKKNQAEQEKILFNFEYNIKNNLEKKYKLNNNLKLYETLGIVLDNAIEASKETKLKIVNINIEEKDQSIIISIQNTFNNEVDLDKFGNKDYSTKKRGSGIGLNYLQKNKTKNLKITYSIKENIFITTIVINKL